MCTLIVSCQPNDDTSKPSAAITSPASDAQVQNTVPIQVDATDNIGVTRIGVSVRGRGSSASGMPIGTAIQSPFVISWNSGGVPNNSALELVATAEDAAGNKSNSAPVRVRVSNTTVPVLNYLVAYTLPPRPAGITAQHLNPNNVGLGLPVAAEKILPPIRANNQDAAQQLNSAIALHPLATANTVFALEWSWQSFANVGSVAGADGYGVYQTKEDLAGPYTPVTKISSTSTGTQKYSKEYADAFAGQKSWGLVTAVVNNRTSETNYSNADTAIFLPGQFASNPPDGATVSDGRPVLSWGATTGVVGYLYFVYDKNPWDANASVVWTNSPNSTDQLAVTYPQLDALGKPRPPLASGTYWWWVAGVSFDEFNKADGFSFSEPRKIVVP